MATYYKVIQNMFLKKRNITIKEKAAANSTEEEYYTQLFIKNEQWNKAFPNEEEQKRWLILEQFIFYVQGYRAATNKNSSIKILDLGCGRGWLTNLLSKYGEVIGIEPVDAVAEYGKKLFPEIHFLTGTAKTLLEKSYTGYFDLIVCSEVIEHVPENEKDKFINEAQQLLNNNGFLIITTPRKEAQGEWMKYCSPDQPIEEWMDEYSVKKLCESQKLKTHLIERFAIRPAQQAPEINIYQLWLFQKI